MRLRGISPGDIVQVNDGLPYVAEVVDVERARLRVRPMIPGRRELAPRTAKAAWITGWWKRMDRSAAA